MEVLATRLLLAVVVLVLLDESSQLLAVELRDVLEDHANVSGVVGTCQLLLVRRVLQDDGLAQILGAGCFQNIPALLEGFVVVCLVGDHHVHTLLLRRRYLLRLLRCAHSSSFKQANLADSGARL